MRNSSWRYKNTVRRIKRKASILAYRGDARQSSYRVQDGRLDKISVSDVIPRQVRPYERAAVRQETRQLVLDASNG